MAIFSIILLPLTSISCYMITGGKTKGGEVGMRMDVGLGLEVSELGSDGRAVVEKRNVAGALHGFTRSLHSNGV